MKKPDLRLVFITPCIGEEFFLPVKKGAGDAAAMMGVDWSFIGTQDVDVLEQVEMVRGAVADGVDGIALSIIDAAAFADPVAEALDAGVSVVAFNVDDRSAPNPRLSGICQDLRGAGRALGTRILGELKPGSRVLLTAHSGGISALDDRMAGIRDVIDGAGIRSSVVITGMDPSAAAEVIGKALDEDPAVGAVLATGQADTEGAGLAASVRERRLEIAGFDLSPQILRMVGKGIIAFTIDQQPYIQGFYPVVQLTLHRRYGIMPSDIDTGAAFITRDNAADVLEFCAEHYR